jgi:hypothetical protein
MEKNIWKDYIDNLHNNNGQPKQGFEALMKECNRLLVSMQGMEMTESNKSERLGLMGLSIQLQTSIAILKKLEAIEAKQD